MLSAFDSATREEHQEKIKSAREEHVFGAITNEQGGRYVRTIGLARANTKIGLRNLVYNIRRCVSIFKINESVA